MIGHGEKLGRRQEQAIAALLTKPTVGEAAEACGIGVATLLRWMCLPGFQEEYRTARRQVIEQAVAQLQQVATDAVATLRRNLSSGVPSVEVRAAVAVLDQAFRGTELLDLDARLAAIEAQLDGRAKDAA